MFRKSLCIAALMVLLSGAAFVEARPAVGKSRPEPLGPCGRLKPDRRSLPSHMPKKTGPGYEKVYEGRHHDWPKTPPPPPPSDGGSLPGGL